MVFRKMFLGWFIEFAEDSRTGGFVRLGFGVGVLESFFAKESFEAMDIFCGVCWTGWVLDWLVSRIGWVLDWLVSRTGWSVFTRLPVGLRGLEGPEGPLGREPLIGRPSFVCGPSLRWPGPPLPGTPDLFDCAGCRGEERLLRLIFSSRPLIWLSYCRSCSSSCAGLKFWICRPLFPELTLPLALGPPSGRAGD